MIAITFLHSKCSGKELSNPSPRIFLVQLNKKTIYSGAICQETNERERLGEEMQLIP